MEKFAADPITYILNYINGPAGEKEKNAPDKNLNNPKYYSMFVGMSQRLGYQGKVTQAADYNNGVKVANSTYHKIENYAYNYYVNNSRSSSGTLSSNGCTAWFDPQTLTLYLQDYSGGPITIIPIYSI